MIYLSIILILLTLIVSWLSILDEFRKKHSDFIIFTFTLVATFIGVFLAIELTNWNDSEKEIQNVIKILRAADVEINSSIEDVDNMIIFAISNLGLGIMHQKDNPLRFPELFKLAISNDALLRILKDYQIGWLYRTFNELRILQEGINEGKPSNDTILISTLGEYKRQLIYTQLLLRLNNDILIGKVNNINDERRRFNQALFDTWPEVKDDLDNQWMDK